MKMILEGLKIIERNYGDCDFAAEHDIIYVGPSFDEEELEEVKSDYGERNKPISMSESDFLTLDYLGWFIDNEFNCWAHFC